MLAITINNNFLKIAVPGRSFFKKIPLDASVVNDCLIINPQLLAAKIREVLKKADITDDDAIIGLNEERTYLKEIFIPISEKEPEPFIVSKLEEMIPFGKQEIIYTRKLLGQDKQEKVFQAAVVEKKFLESYIKTFELSGLRLIGLIPLALSLAKVAPATDRPNLIICLEDNELVYILVSTHGGVSFSATYSLERDIKDSKSTFGKWTNEVLRFSDGRVAGKDVTKIFVCGEGQYLMEEFLGKIKLVTESLPDDKLSKSHNFAKTVSLINFESGDLNLLLPARGKRTLKLDTVKALIRKIARRS